MRKLLFLLSIFAIVLSCSSDETSTPVTPPPAPIAKYTITLSAGEGGTVSTTGGEYEAGQTVSITATPQGEYLFKDWSDGNTNATRTITVNSNITLTANFEKRKYPLTVNFVGEGEVIEEIVNAGRTTEYDSGTTVKLTAQAAAEWVFVGWTGDIESSEESVQIVIGEPKEVTATFEKKKYPLSVNIEGEGEVIEEIVEASRTTDYNSGTTVKLTAEPADEWLFTGWSGDIGDIDPTENPIQLSIIESKTVTATFEKKKYPLTVNIEGEGEVLEEIVNAGRTTDYDSGTTVRLTAQPEDEWVFTRWSGDIGDIEPTENPIQLNIIESKTVTATFEIENYFSINVIGNGTYQRLNSPYPPLEYEIELISGNKNENGNYSKGSIIRLSAKENPGWEIDYSQINQSLPLGQDIIVEDNLEFILNVRTGFAPTRDTFPFNELNSDGTFLNVGTNIGAYPEWNEPNSELNYYITDNFMYPEYVEVYKDRIFEIRQLLGEWGPLDILIYDWEQNPVQNREMWLETRETLAAEAYRNQLIGNVQNWVNQEMEYYDEAVLNNGWPFGSAFVGMGFGKHIGLIFKNKNWEYLETWANGTGLEVADLIQTEEFNWEFETASYHEYIHVWQGSQNKHGFVNTIAGCYNCNAFSDKDPNLNRIWVAPRWFQEGQCAVIQSILSEKMELRAEQGHCCTIPPPIFKVREYIKNYLLNNNLDNLRRDETDMNGYYTIGEAASFYKFAKMNYSLETYMAFETHRGAYGYASALQAYLGMSEDEFYTTFNNWFFDSNLSIKEKLDYLYPEGINPIQMDILKRR